MKPRHDLPIELGFLIEQSVHGGVVNHIAKPTMNAEQTALDAYLAHTAAIHWGRVGDLGRVETALNELLAIFGNAE